MERAWCAYDDGGYDLIAQLAKCMLANSQFLEFVKITRGSGRDLSQTGDCSFEQENIRKR